VTNEYDPLAYASLAESIVNKMKTIPHRALVSATKVSGAGVYVIGAYSPKDIYPSMTNPIVYVGRARPSSLNLGLTNGRSVTPRSSGRRGPPLRGRLSKHREAIEQAENLDLDNFWFKTLRIVPAFIDLAEEALIHWHCPVWNRALKGFGNKNPGKGRRGQKVSEWDTMHPGRNWIEHHKVTRDRETLLKKVEDWLLANQP
jgi:hypothetical protein